MTYEEFLNSPVTNKEEADKFDEYFFRINRYSKLYSIYSFERINERKLEKSIAKKLKNQTKRVALAKELINVLLNAISDEPETLFANSLNSDEDFKTFNLKILNDYENRILVLTRYLRINLKLNDDKDKQEKVAEIFKRIQDKLSLLRQAAEFYITSDVETYRKGTTDIITPMTTYANCVICLQAVLSDSKKTIEKHLDITPNPELVKQLVDDYKAYIDVVKSANLLNHIVGGDLNA